MYPKLCEICGKEFLAKTKSQKYCNCEHHRKCVVCGNDFIVDTHYVKRKTCSKQCAKLLRKSNAETTSLQKYGVKNAGYTEQSQKKIKATCEAKYGVEHVSQAESCKQHMKDSFMHKYGTDNPMKVNDVKRKAQDTCLSRYGAKSVLSKESSVRSKINQTNLEKYGTLDPGNSKESKEKRKQTCLDRYGTEYASQSRIVKQKREDTCLQKYSAKSPLESEEIQSKIKRTMIDKYGHVNPFECSDIRSKIANTLQTNYGVPYACMLPQCIDASGAKISNLNRSFSNYLLSLDIPNELEFKIDSYSYDVHVLNSNVLIEIDPSWTHSTYPTPKFGSISKEYHTNKTNEAKKHGYRCIHIFDWDDSRKVAKMLQHKNTMYARKCSVETISERECNEFLSEYHLQGTCRGQEIRLGLKQDNRLLGVMTFGKPRYNNKFEYELLRLCYDPSIQIVGGSRKLFKSFINSEFQPNSILSYCDNSKFNGDVYISLGFKLADKGSPSKHWSKGSKQITQNLLNQRGYDQLFNTKYGKGTSNEELMLKNKWLPVYDCGQSRYEWRRY